MFVWKMKSKIIIIAFLGMLLLVLFATQFTGNVNGEFSNEATFFEYKSQPLRMTDQPNHLFHFVQVYNLFII